jgi:phosphoserine phosphatase RsbU/P
MLILTIDDDDLVRESISVYLEDSGFEVIEANNGQQGVQQFREQKPDVVLCDLRMPDMDGMQVLEVITKEAPNVPVIIISGAGIINNVVEALRLGAWDYLVKPIVDMTILEQTIHSAYKNKIGDENLQEEDAELDDEFLEENLMEAQWDKEELAKLQLQLLPNPVESINGLNFSHRLMNEDANLDFAVDYVIINEKQVAFYIIDLTSYGPNKAFIAMMIKSFVSQVYRRFRAKNDLLISQPANMLRYLNLETHKANVPQSIPTFFAVVDNEKKQLNFSNAGLYPSPKIVDQDGQERELASDGMAIGMFPWTQYQEVKVAFNKSAQQMIFIPEHQESPFITIK